MKTEAVVCMRGMAQMIIVSGADHFCGQAMQMLAVRPDGVVVGAFLAADVMFAFIADVVDSPCDCPVCNRSGLN